MNKYRKVSFVWKPKDLLIPGVICFLMGLVIFYISNHYETLFMSVQSVAGLAGLLLGCSSFMIAAGIHALTGEDVDDL